MLQDGDAKENTYKKTHPDMEGVKGPATSDSDPLTNLGGQGFVLLLLVLIKVWA